MDGDLILAIYEQISRITRQMLGAARCNDWDRLIALEKECSAQFARLFENEDNQARDAEFQRAKANLIRSVLDDDAQIRLLLEPWLANLSALIGSTRQQNRLNQAYHSEQ